MAHIPVAPVERIIRDIDPDIRVSTSAAEVLRDVLEERALEVAKKAVQYARHARRKTVKPEDIELAK
ncbi:MAG: histone family protein [Candidatus Altiarchaeota archaeon]